MKGRALQPETKRLPVNAEEGLARHARMGHEAAAQRRAIERVTLHRQRSVKEQLTVLPILHVHEQTVAWVEELPGVVLVHAHERRDMKLLGE